MTNRFVNRLYIIHYSILENGRYERMATFQHILKRARNLRRSTACTPWAAWCQVSVSRTWRTALSRMRIFDNMSNSQAKNLYKSYMSRYMAATVSPLTTFYFHWFSSHRIQSYFATLFSTFPYTALSPVSFRTLSTPYLSISLSM